MIIQTSFSNKSRFLNCFKDVFYRNKGIGIFYFCLSFVFLPLQYIMTSARYKGDLVAYSYNFLNNAYTPFSLVMFYGLTVAMAFAIPIIMLSYMQNKRAVDVYHSLPFTRNELLGANLLSGFLYMLIPIAVNFGIVAVASAMRGQNALVILAEIFYWTAPILGIMSITALACVLVGTTFDSFLFACGLHATPLILWFIYFSLSAAFLLGFDDNFMVMNNLSKLSPFLIRLPYIGADYEHISENFIKNQLIITVIWIFIAIAIFALTFYAYNKRKSEQAETATEKGPLSMLLRLVGTASGGLLLAVIFSLTTELSYNSKSFLGFTFLGSVIVYLVGDVIISKRIRSIKKAFIPGAVFSLVVVLITSCFFFDLTGFSKKLPERSEIESVRVGSHGMNYAGRFENQPNYRLNYVEYTSDEAIDAIYSFHKSQSEHIKDTGITKVRENANSNYSGFYVDTITYTLKDGSKFIRNFHKILYPDTESIIKFESTDEFIENIHPIFHVNEEMVASVRSVNLFGSKALNMNLSTREIDTLLMALREDMLSDTGKDVLNKKPLGKISFLVFENDIRKSYSWPEDDLEHYDSNSLSEITVAVTDGFENTLDFLNRIGKAVNFTNDTDDLRGAYILNPAGGLKPLKEINYNDAYSTMFSKDEPLNMSAEDVSFIKDDLRAAALYGVPYAKIMFITDGVPLRDINRVTETRFGPDGEITTTSYEESAEIYPTISDEEIRATGSAFIKYEVLPENLKRTFMEELSRYYVDSWILNNCGMTEEFYVSECEKLGMEPNLNNL